MHSPEGIRWHKGADDAAFCAFIVRFCALCAAEPSKSPQRAPRKSRNPLWATTVIMKRSILLKEVTILLSAITPASWDSQPMKEPLANALTNHLRVCRRFWPISFENRLLSSRPRFWPIGGEAACAEGWARESAGWTKIITPNRSTEEKDYDRNSPDGE